MNERNDEEYIKIDLLKLAEAMLKRWWVIVIAMLVGAGGCLFYSTCMVTPLYQASTLMYVNNSSISKGTSGVSITASEISAAKSLVKTYLVILETRLTLEEVIEHGELKCSYQQLRGMVQTEVIDNTEIFSVIVTSSDPQEAEHIANTIAQVLPKKIASIVAGSSVHIVDYAEVPDKPIWPNVSNYVINGMMFGLLLSSAVLVIMELLDDRIHSENYLLEEYKDIPLLTVVPDLLEDAAARDQRQTNGQHGADRGSQGSRND